MLQGEASHRSHLWRCKTWSPPCSLLACQTLQRRLIQVRIEKPRSPFSKFTTTSSLQAWRLATITRRALTRSTRTTQAPSPTQITEHHLQAVSCQSSSPLQCSSLDTQANECVDLSEFYLSRLILYDYGLSHVINCTYTLCYKYSEFCKIWLWKYSKKTYVHSFSFMLKAAGRYQRQHGAIDDSNLSVSTAPTNLFFYTKPKKARNSPKNGSSPLPLLLNAYYQIFLSTSPKCLFRRSTPKNL